MKIILLDCPIIGIKTAQARTSLLEQWKCEKQLRAGDEDVSSSVQHQVIASEHSTKTG